MNGIDFAFAVEIAKKEFRKQRPAKRRVRGSRARKGILWAILWGFFV